MIMKKLFAVLMIALMSFGSVTSSYALPIQQTKHLKKDGTPDKRFKENKKHLTKAGKPDMRYKANNPNAGKKKNK
jgi:hypothetical protein